MELLSYDMVIAVSDWTAAEAEGEGEGLKSRQIQVQSLRMSVAALVNSLNGRTTHTSDCNGSSISNSNSSSSSSRSHKEKKSDLRKGSPLPHPPLLPPTQALLLLVGEWEGEGLGQNGEGGGDPFSDACTHLVCPPPPPSLLPHRYACLSAHLFSLSVCLSSSKSPSSTLRKKSKKPQVQDLLDPCTSFSSSSSSSSPHPTFSLSSVCHQITSLLSSSINYSFSLQVLFALAKGVPIVSNAWIERCQAEQVRSSVTQYLEG